MADFTLHLLGAPVLEGPAGPVGGRASHKRRIALLAVLALARGRPVGRERLMGLLWGEQPAESARHSLSESLYVLRKELGEEALGGAGGDVALSPAAVESDVGRFEAALEAGALEEAVRAYGGPFLDGFYVADAPEFERWAEGERDRLARACAGAVERLAEAAEGEGSLIRAVEWWRRLAALDPFSSRAALRLVRALDAAGERPAAVRAAETHAALLRAELEVEPDPELVAFVEHLRAEPVRPPRAAAPPPPLPEPVLPPPPDPAAEEPEPPVAPAAEAPPEVAPARAPATGEGRARRGWGRAALLAGAAAVLAGVLVASWPAGGGGGGEEARAEAGPRYDPRRIAVLYFDDHSPGKALDYLASGLTEMLIHELSQVDALDVVSRNGVKPYRDGEARFDSLVADLRVGSVVEGSLQRSGDSVRVTVQLIDANTGVHLESRVVVHPMADVFALESALAEEVAGFLRRRLGAEIRLAEARAGTKSAAARALLLQGEELSDQAQGMAGDRDPLDAASAERLFRRADSLLARAEAADSRWARPTVARGWVAYRRGRLAGPPRSAAFLAQAEAHAARVLAREPASAPALELRGAALFLGAASLAAPAAQDPRLERAERDLRAAVAADPSLASAWGVLSQVLRYRGRFAEGDLAARRALAEDAYLAEADAILHRLYSSALIQADYREAGALCERGRRQFPADWRFLECGLTLLRDDPSLPADPARARRLLAELERVDPASRAHAAGRPYSPVYRQALAAGVLARAGETDSARAMVARARVAAEADPEARVSLLYDEAAVRVLLGEREAARRLLDEFLAARPALRSFVLRDPLFRGLFTPAAAAP